MSLSNDAVMNVLKNQFVCGYRNIAGEPYAGRSGHHETDSPAVLTTNGAGPHSVQMFFLNSDGTALHCPASGRRRICSSKSSLPRI